MRPIETLLAFATLLAFLAQAVPLPPTVRWMRHAAPAAALAAIAQIVAEGPRWPMVPAYALALLFFVVWLVRGSASAGGPSAREPIHAKSAAVRIALGALGLFAAFALPVAMPVFRFPHPSGPYAIGTLTCQWVDRSRPEVFGPDPSERRQLVMQIWYPAQTRPSASHAAYMPDADVVTAAFAHIHATPAFLFGQLKYVTTHAMPSAAAAADRPRYPVLLFLEGATGFRQMNTFQVEHLVSHGYIVVALDQPGAAAAVVFSDGRLATGLGLTQFHGMVSPAYLPAPKGSSLPSTLLASGRTLPESSIIPYLARDVTFTLDRLAMLDRSDPNGILTGRLDLRRVGVFGVSLGGIVAGEACRVDSRLRACLMMDAPMPTDVVEAGLQQPGMWITRDAASMRLERQRTGGWPDAEIEAHQTTMRAVYDGLPGAGYFVQVPGTFHTNFTDIPMWTPLAPQLGLSGPIGERRAHDIINAYTLAFFDQHLLNRPGRLLHASARQFPEVTLESRRP